MLRFLILLPFLFPLFPRAQDTLKKPIPRKLNWDTTRYQKFDYSLILGYYQQYRSFEHSLKGQDSLGELTYLAESPLNSGLSFCYDKFQLSLSTGNSPQSQADKKGRTRVFNIGFSVGDNSYLLDNYFRRFAGFHVVETEKFDTAFKRTGDFYKLPSMVTSQFVSKFLYFTNADRFSHKATMGCNYRQLKSAASWILGASVNGLSTRSDSAMIPRETRSAFRDFASMSAFSSFNVSVNAGAALTIVLWKAWFASAYFTVGPEQQWRNYSLGETRRQLSYIGFGGTGRFSIGLNMKKFYMIAAGTSDYNTFNSSGLKYTTRSITGYFSLGWRFSTGIPKFYRRFQESWLYKKL